MKLRNKKTGEIIETYEIIHNGQDKIRMRKPNGDFDSYPYEYKSLTDLNAEWEDYEEPKEYWWIDSCGDVLQEYFDGGCVDKQRKQIGNYFETKEEAEKAVEKLKAWKRLKDKGFRFEGYNAQAFGEIKFSIEDDWEDCNFDHLQHKADLDLLFGGEK